MSWLKSTSSATTDAECEPLTGADGQPVTETGDSDYIPIIVVPNSEDVPFEAHAEDVIHSFWIPALNGKRDAVPGRKHPLLIEAFAERVLVSRPEPGETIVFTAHSLPVRVVTAGDPYPREFEATARLVATRCRLGSYETAYQSAVVYARERLQGRALKGPAAPDKPADPILVHPDVRRMLLTMRAYVEGSRALAAWVAMHLDIAAKHPDPETRQEAEDLVSLMTPVVKAFVTDIGSECAFSARASAATLWAGARSDRLHHGARARSRRDRVRARAGLPRWRPGAARGRCAKAPGGHAPARPLSPYLYYDAANPRFNPAQAPGEPPHMILQARLADRYERIPG